MSSDHLSYLKIPMIRTGECDSCINTYPMAWCCSDCSAVEVAFTVTEPTLAEFLKAKGFEIGDNGRISFSIRKKCDKYDDATRKCKIYATRPKICRDFPRMFSQMYESLPSGRMKMCSYEWVWDSNGGVDVDMFRLIEVLGIEV